MITKVAAVVIENNTFLMVRKVGKDMWTSLGRHIKEGESEQEALLREIQEEVSCDATIIKKLGDFYAPAAFDNDTLRLATYLVELHGTINVQDPELKEAKFITQTNEALMPESITKHVISHCINKGILDW